MGLLVILLLGCRPRPLEALPMVAVVRESLPSPDGFEAVATLPRLPPDSLRVHVIDVGQGAATLLEFPCGAVLVDAGGEKDTKIDATASLTAYLDAFFATRPDLGRALSTVFVTHPHIDHVRGFAAGNADLAVQNRYVVRGVVTDGVGTGSGRSQQAGLESWADAHHVPVRHVAAADVPAGGLTDAVIDAVGTCPASAIDPVVRVLWGDDGKPGSENDDSVVVRVDLGAASAVVTGDLQQSVMSRFIARHHGTDALDADVYQAGHHGARNGTRPDLVDAISPDAAVIACGPYEWTIDDTGGGAIAREYGHPNGATVGTLEAGVSRSRPAVAVQVGVKGSAPGHARTSKFEPRTVTRAVFATGWDGTVVLTLRASDGAISVSTTGR